MPGKHQDIDLYGLRYGKLTVISHKTYKKEGKTGYYVLCRCDCGNTREVMYHNLLNGSTTSCGCARKLAITKHVNLAGKRYGRLTVLSDQCYKAPGKTGYYVLCRCDCGNTREVIYNNLLKGNATSCGCYHKERVSKSRDLCGQRFGKLVVISRGSFYVPEKNAYYVKCRCDCGNICAVRQGSLKNGKAKSCGCLRHKYPGNNPESSRLLGHKEIITPYAQTRIMAAAYPAQITVNNEEYSDPETGKFSQPRNLRNLQKMANA